MKIKQSGDISELVEKARNADSEAFEKIYDIFATKILKFISYKVQTKADAEDISSEVWLQVVKSLKSYNSKSSFQTWLYGIAKNVIFQYYRDKYSNKEDAVFDEFFDNLKSGESEYDFEENLEKENLMIQKEGIVNRILKSLNEVQKKVLELRFLKGYKISEVAEELELSESNVKVTQMRAIAKLKKNYIEYDQIKQEGDF